MGLYLLDYGAGNVQSLANTLSMLGHEFTWITCAEDFKHASSLVFPGVGAFQTAISNLETKGLLEPLKEYILSGRPYFGICIGMQVLFEASAECPSFRGLGIIPSPISRFDDADKAVPHMGWNTSDLVHNDPEMIQDSKRYYFVHSYCAKYDAERYHEAAKYAYTTTQYGQEVFISSVRKGNVFGTQFHPEKSGTNGLALLDAWLRATPDATSTIPSLCPPSIQPKRQHRLTKRIIACMDVRANDAGDLVVTKGDQYDVREKHAVTATTGGTVRNLGKPVILAEQYYKDGADELCLLNITSFRQSPLGDQPMLAVVRAAAERVFVPLTIGGGIKDSVDPDGTRHPALEVAGTYFRAGADKVSIGSEAVIAVEKMHANGGRGDGSSAIETIAHAYGRQAVVVSIDPRRVYVDPETYDGPYKAELVYGENGKAWWYQCTISGGRESRPLSVVQLAKGVELLGAGELLVNSIDRDGSGLGFDLDLIRLVKSAVRIPVVASSGAGRKEHFLDVFQQTDVESALAAGIFHRKEVSIEEVKLCLEESNVNVRR